MPLDSINKDQIPRVTLALLGAKLDEIQARLEEYHKDLKEHILKDEAQFEPLKIFSERVYAGMVLILAIVGFLGWNQIQRLFTIEVIKP